MIRGGVVKEREEKVTTEKGMMAMRPERSKSLHNFEMPTPWLKWGNQKFLRCMKVNQVSSSDNRSRSLQASGTLVNRDNRDFNFEKKRRSPNAETHKNSPATKLIIKNTKYNGDGIEAVREKLMFDLKTAADEIKVAILKEGDNDDDDDDVEDDEPSAVATVAEATVVAAASSGSAEAERPWNLRTRRAACKAPSVNGKNSAKFEERKSSNLPMRTENLMKSPRLRLGAVVGGNGGEKKKERAKFTVPLSRKEIEEDYFAMLGEKAPRRPKKRPRNVQRQLDTLFPGLWLTEVTHDMYKVSEFPESGKR